MSSSRKRQNVDPAEVAKKRRNKVLGIMGGVLVVLLIIGSFVVNSNYFHNKATAVTIGDEEYTASELNYFYYTVYNQFYSDLGDYAPLVIDQSKSLAEQYYAEGESYKDYFTQSAISNLTDITAVYKKALAEGLTLSEERQKSVDDGIATVEAYASIYGKTTDQYLSEMYGKGFNIATLEKLLTRINMASEYYNSKIDSFEYTEEEIKAAYAEKKDDYDVFSFRVYYLANGEDAEAAYATADEIATAKDSDEFAKLVYENATEDDKESFLESEATLYYNTGTSLSSYDYGDWLKESGRSEYDTTVIESSSGEGYYVLMFLDRDENDYNTVSMRHILINVEEDEEDGITEENKATAKAAIEEIRKEFEAGDKSAESFAALANEKSEDTGSNTNGGLYETIGHNQLVEPISDYIFDDARKSGDTEVIYYEGDNYVGYHLVYFVGEGENFSDYIATNNLRVSDYNTWLESEKANYPAETHYSLRFVG